MIAPTWFRPWMAWLAIVAAMAVLLGLQTLRLSDERTEHANTKTAWSDERTTLERQAREAVQAARDEEQRKTKDVQKEADEAQKQLVVAAADADAARDAGERLRKQVAILTAALRSSGSGKPASANPSASADPALDLLADMQRRIDEATDGIAGFADKSHTSGLACERSYDALTPAARVGLGLKR